jgi:DNA repair protein RecO (recombination protein O)
MHLTARAIILSVSAHGEHGAVVRALTRQEGVQPGFVRGGRSRRLRPVLLPGNEVEADYRARTETQLAALSVELVTSRAPLLAEPLAAGAIEWLTAFTASALPEAQPYPRLFDALGGVLAAIEAAQSARGWAVGLVRYELLLLSALGFGLDLDECAATGVREDLRYVSPRSGRAVSGEGGAAFADRLLALPSFVLKGGSAQWDDIYAGLALTGHFIARDLLIERRADVLAARERLVERLRRVTR